MPVQIDVDVVGFLGQSANIASNASGDVIITTGPSAGAASQFFLKAVGEISVGARRLAFFDEIGGGGSLPAGTATESYVDNAVEGLASETYVDNKIQEAIGSGGGTPVTLPAWTKPTLLNNWKAYPVGPTVPHEAPGFRVVGHRVELTGSLAGGEVVGAGIQSGQTCVIFRLPVGARPTLGQKTLLVSAPGNTVGTIKVFPDGQVVYVAGSLQGEISLHGVSFTKD